MLLIWACVKNVVGAAGNAVRSAKTTIPFRPTFVSHGVGLGLGHPEDVSGQLGEPARFISSNPPSSYTAKAYLPITAAGAGTWTGPCGVTSTQSGAINVGAGEGFTLVSLGLPLGSK